MLLLLVFVVAKRKTHCSSTKWIKLRGSHWPKTIWCNWSMVNSIGSINNTCAESHIHSSCNAMKIIIITSRSERYCSLLFILASESGATASPLVVSRRSLWTQTMQYHYIIHKRVVGPINSLSGFQVPLSIAILDRKVFQFQRSFLVPHSGYVIRAVESSRGSTNSPRQFDQREQVVIYFMLMQIV